MIQFDTQNNPYLEEIENEVVPILNDIDAVCSMVNDLEKIVKLSESLSDKVYSFYGSHSDAVLVVHLIDTERLKHANYSFLTNDIVDELRRLADICDELSERSANVSGKTLSQKTDDDILIIDAYLYFYDVYQKVKKIMKKTFPDFRF